VVAVVAAVTTTTAALVIRQHRAVEQPVEIYGVVPDFTLVDRAGRTVTQRNFLDKISVVDFFYTQCTDACPLQTAQMARLQADYAGRRALQLISITVDPGHDDRETLARYAERYGADPSRWLFLTGPREVIYRLAVDGFHLATIASVPAGAASPWSWLAPASAWAHEDEASPGIIQLTHASRFALVDRHGRIRNYFDGTDWDAVKRLATELEQLLAARD
jgi:protein SCO1/2